MKFNRLIKLGLACGCYLRIIQVLSFVIESIFVCLLFELGQLEVGLTESKMSLKVGLYRIQMEHMHSESDNH